MTKWLFVAVLLAMPVPVAAEGEFTEGSQAKSWGLLGEEKALFEARVVDILCELSGDCAPNCGDGRRYLGLVRSADQALIIASKNAQGVFTGAGVDLLPYCGRTVEVDGLLIGDADTTPAKVFQVQRIREPGGNWVAANHWTRAWDAAHPDLAAVEGRWYRKDPRVLKRIETEGYLGLGLEADEAFKEYWFSE